MASTPAEAASPSSATARAGLAGAGGGTGLVAFAQSVSPDSTTKSLLLYLAPSVSVIFGTLVFFIEAQTSRYLQQRLVRRLRRTLEEYLQNPHTSDEHKLALRQRLEQVEQTVTLQEVERIRVIGAVPPDSGSSRG